MEGERVKNVEGGRERVGGGREEEGTESGKCGGRERGGGKCGGCMCMVNSQSKGICTMQAVKYTELSWMGNLNTQPWGF